MKSYRDRAVRAAEQAKEIAASASKALAFVPERFELSDEGKAQERERILKDAQARIADKLDAHRDAAASAGERANKKLAELRHVPDAELAARAAVLQPVIAAAAENPEALIAAYTKRFGNKADRRLLEEVAQGMLDAGLGGIAFAEQWQRAQPQPTAEELELMNEAREHQEVTTYLDSVGSVINTDLRELVGEASGMEMIGRERARSNAKRFEGGGEIFGRYAAIA